jgi:hypothetical protein
MEELKKIIEEINKIKSGIKGFKPTDDKILEVAARIYVSDKISRERKENRGATGTKREHGGKPTPRQIEYLKNKGVDIPENLTFEEASRVIGEIIEGEKRGAY